METITKDMDDSIFVKTFGASPKVKVLNFLLDNDILFDIFGDDGPGLVTQ